MTKHNDKEILGRLLKTAFLFLCPSQRFLAGLKTLSPMQGHFLSPAQPTGGRMMSIFTDSQNHSTIVEIIKKTTIDRKPAYWILLPTGLSKLVWATSVQIIKGV